MDVQLLGDEGVTMPDMPEEAFDDAKSVKSAVTTATVLPPQPQPEGTVDVQMFNKLVKEMREDGENIQKLKQQGKLLQVRHWKYWRHHCALQ
ncbi:hypothetical protein EBR96_10835 [bacterium]|nr:hypothetical protein [bacterium]